MGIVYRYKDDVPDRLAYEISHLILAVVYIILSGAALWNIVRVAMVKRNVAFQHLHPRGTNNVWHYMFNPLFFIGALMRVAAFILQALIYEGRVPIDNATNFQILYVPSFLFFATYLIILFRWANIYHNSYEISSVKVRYLQKLLFWIIVIMFSILFGLCIFDEVESNKTDNVPTIEDKSELAIVIYCIFLYISTSLGFVFYGLCLSIKIAKMPVRSPTLVLHCERIQRFTTLVCFAFMVRSAFLIYFTIDQSVIAGWWWFDIAYYSCLEVLPLIVMLYVLKMANRKADNTESAVAPLIRPHLPPAEIYT